MIKKILLGGRNKILKMGMACVGLEQMDDKMVILVRKLESEIIEIIQYIEFLYIAIKQSIIVQPDDKYNLTFEKNTPFLSYKYKLLIG